MQFEIDDAFDVAGDPGGHYRHGTILCGTLTSGTLTSQTRLLVPTVHGPCPVTLIGVERFKEVLHLPVSASEISEPVGIYTSHPALPRQVIERSVARSTTQVEPSLIEQLFVAAPEIFLHYQCRDNRYPVLCRYCDEPLMLIPDHLARVGRLVDRSDAQLADSARQYIARFSRGTDARKTPRSWWHRLLGRR